MDSTQKQNKIGPVISQCTSVYIVTNNYEDYEDSSNSSNYIAFHITIGDIPYSKWHGTFSAHMHEQPHAHTHTLSLHSTSIQ